MTLEELSDRAGGPQLTWTEAQATGFSSKDSGQLFFHTVHVPGRYHDEHVRTADGWRFAKPTLGARMVRRLADGEFRLTSSIGEDATL
jgi:hypothetical protein